MVGAGHRTGGCDREGDTVVLVDELDAELGTVGRHRAHLVPGQLHRAVSVCLLDVDGRALLQQRAASKPHFAGRWSNACCTHPRPGEAPADAAVRRVREELGLRIVELDHCGFFVYRALDVESGLVEHELDHVFTGVTAERPQPAPAEVMDWAYVEVDAGDLARFDGPAYTPWLRPVLERALW